MVALGEHASVAPRDSIDGARKTRTDRHHPAPERVLIPGFDDEVRVIALQRVVHDPEVATLAAVREGALDLPHDARVAERWETGPQAQGDVRGHQSRERLAGDVRHGGTLAGLAAGAQPPPTPPPGFGQDERELRGALRHLEFSYLIPVGSFEVNLFVGREMPVNGRLTLQTARRAGLQRQRAE